MTTYIQACKSVVSGANKVAKANGTLTGRQYRAIGHAMADKVNATTHRENLLSMGLDGGFANSSRTIYSHANWAIKNLDDVDAAYFQTITDEDAATIEAAYSQYLADNKAAKAAKDDENSDEGEASDTETDKDPDTILAGLLATVAAYAAKHDRQDKVIEWARQYEADVKFADMVATI